MNIYLIGSSKNLKGRLRSMHIWGRTSWCSCCFMGRFWRILRRSIAGNMGSICASREMESMEKQYILVIIPIIKSSFSISLGIRCNNILGIIMQFITHNHNQTLSYLDQTLNLLVYLEIKTHNLHLVVVYLEILTFNLLAYSEILQLVVYLEILILNLLQIICLEIQTHSRLAATHLPLTKLNSSSVS